MTGTIVKVLNGQDLSTDEMVGVIGLVASAAEGDAEATTEIYNTLSMIEEAVVSPAVFSSIAENEEVTAPHVIFSELFEVAVEEADSIQYETYINEESGEEETAFTGKTAVLLATNIIPSAFPTVSLAYLAEALLAYNFDYRVTLLEEIIEKRFTIVAVRENQCMHLIEVM